MALPGKLINLTSAPLQIIARPSEGYVLEGEGILIPVSGDTFEVAPEIYALHEVEILKLVDLGFLAIVSPPSNSRTTLEQLYKDVLFVPDEEFPATGSTATFFLGKN